MIQRPLVSVLMPSYNQCNFIEESIASVLGQSYGDIELVVADGGSTDGTVELLHALQEKDKRLRWLSERDSGPAEALNRAFALTRGTHIGWLNSDDLYAEGAAERAVAGFAAHPDWIMLYGRGVHVDESGKELGRYPTMPPTVPVEEFRKGCFICQPTAFFLRPMYRLLGSFNQSLKTAFDYDYWLRAFLAFPERLGFIDAVQAKSRLHSDCITVRMRKVVAVESMRVIAEHLGSAPSHWFTTYVEELMAQSPEERAVPDVRQHLLDTLEEVRDCLGDVETESLKNALLENL